jgi:hypothetical protein
MSEDWRFFPYTIGESSSKAQEQGGKYDGWETPGVTG